MHHNLNTSRIARIFILPALLVGGVTQASAQNALQSFTTRAAGLNLRVVKAKLDRVRVKAGLGQGIVGRPEPLAGIARRYGALAAINGGYFDAYTKSAIQNPTHTIVTGGQVAHLGNIGSLIGFTAGNQARIERVPLAIQGTLNGVDNWFAYWINRDPATTPRTITIFTPLWGREIGLNDAPQVVVSAGAITQITRVSPEIPRDGFVIYFRNADDMLPKFRLGFKCEYKIVPQNGDAQRWNAVREAIGCGPRLVAGGQIALDAPGEGFSSPKVLSLSTARSAVGLTRDGNLLLVTSSGTLQQMAQAMKALGAWDALNLDGGASTGLWLKGKYLTAPGRRLTSALLILAK